MLREGTRVSRRERTGGSRRGCRLHKGNGRLPALGRQSPQGDGAQRKCGDCGGRNLAGGSWVQCGDQGLNQRHRNSRRGQVVQENPARERNVSVGRAGLGWALGEESGGALLGRVVLRIKYNYPLPTHQIAVLFGPGSSPPSVCFLGPHRPLPLKIPHLGPWLPTPTRLSPSPSPLVHECPSGYLFPLTLPRRFRVLGCSPRALAGVLRTPASIGQVVLPPS